MDSIQVQLTPQQSFDPRLLHHIENHCKNKLRSANLKIQQQRAKAAQKIHASKKKARCIGFQQGLTEVQGNSAELLIAAERAYHNAISTAHSDCLKLAIDIAHTVISKRIAVEHEAFITRIQKALCTLHLEREIQLLVHPDNYQIAHDHLSTLQNTARVTLIRSSGVEPGNATLITSAGRTELDWKQHFEMICNGLKESLHCTLSSSNIESADKRHGTEEP